MAVCFGGTEAPQVTSEISDTCLTVGARFAALDRRCSGLQSQMGPGKSPSGVTIFVTKAPQIAGLGWQEDDNSLWGLCSLPYFPTLRYLPRVPGFIFIIAGTEPVIAQSLQRVERMRLGNYSPHWLAVWGSLLLEGER